MQRRWGEVCSACGVGLGLRKRPSILRVTRKPPPMLTDERRSAKAPSSCEAPRGLAAIAGISSMPPTAVMPEMALVTDMRGEWSAGRTPLTAWKPASPVSYF